MLPSGIFFLKKSTAMYIQLENIQNVKEENENIFFTIAYFTAYYFLSGIIAFSGVSLILNPSSLLESMKISLTLPTIVLIAIVSFITVLETLLGLSLLLRLKVKQNLIIASAILFGVLVFNIYCCAIEVPVDSGFFGGIINSQFDISTIIKNAAFLVVTASLAAKELLFPD